MTNPEDNPIAIKDVGGVEGWRHSPARTYQLADDPGDGGPPLATIRIGRRKFTTRRAMAEFLAARMSTTPVPRKRLTPEQLERRRATRAANKAKALLATEVRP